MRSIVYHPKVPAEVRKIIQHYEEISPQKITTKICVWYTVLTAMIYGMHYLLTTL